MAQLHSLHWFAISSLKNTLTALELGSEVGLLSKFPTTTKSTCNYVYEPILGFAPRGEKYLNVGEVKTTFSTRSQKI